MQTIIATTLFVIFALVGNGKAQDQQISDAINLGTIFYALIIVLGTGVVAFTPFLLFTAAIKYLLIFPALLIEFFVFILCEFEDWCNRKGFKCF